MVEQNPGDLKDYNRSKIVAYLSKDLLGTNATLRDIYFGVAVLEFLEGTIEGRRSQPETS